MLGSQAAFERPLRLPDDTAVPVRITQAASGAVPELLVAVEATTLSASDQEQICSQVRPTPFHMPLLSNTSSHAPRQALLASSPIINIEFPLNGPCPSPMQYLERTQIGVPKEK